MIRKTALAVEAEYAAARARARKSIESGAPGSGNSADRTGEGASRESASVGDVGGVDEEASSRANGAGQTRGEGEIEESKDEVGNNSEMDIEMQLTQGISTSSSANGGNRTSPNTQNRTRFGSGSIKVSPTKEKEKSALGSQENEEVRLLNHGIVVFVYGGYRFVTLLNLCSYFVHRYHTARLVRSHSNISYSLSLHIILRSSPRVVLDRELFLGLNELFISLNLSTVLMSI